MLLAVTLGLAVALGPLLLGGEPWWAAALIQSATIAGLTLWLSWRTLLGHYRVPSRRNIIWTLGLVALGGASAALSPVSGATRPAWYAMLGALWMFPAIPSLSKDQRVHIDNSIRIVAWILVVLVFYQRWISGGHPPQGTFLTPAAYAGCVLLLMPIAAERRDWLLAAGLFCTLWWTGSEGAWFGFFAALVLTGRWSHNIRMWTGVIGLAICSIAVYNQLQSPEVLARWHRWSAAAAMVYERPWLGFGPGAFERACLWFLPPGAAPSVRASQSVLHLAAEFGLPFSFLFFSGIWKCLFTGRSFKRFGALALFIHSLWDAALWIPANLWLFSYCAASSISETPDGKNVPSAWRIPICAAIMAAGVLLSMKAVDRWRVGREKALAVDFMAEGRWRAAAAAAREAISHDAGDVDAYSMAARSAESLGTGASVDFRRRIAELNPYDCFNWNALSRSLAQGQGHKKLVVPAACSLKPEAGGGV